MADEFECGLYETVEAKEPIAARILGPRLAAYILPNYASEQECLDAILDGSVESLPWQIDAKGEVFSNVPICGGHIYSQPVNKGPQPAPIMIVGKMPRPADVEDIEDPHFIPSVFNTGSKAGQFFLDTSKAYGVDPSSWYVTYLFKCLHPEDANKGSRLKAGWLAESFPILQYEIQQVAPSYILLFGAEAVKAVFGHKAKITELTGSVLDYTYVDFNGNEKTAKCVACTSPHAVIRSSDSEEEAKYKSAFGLFANTIQGITVTDDIEHIAVHNIQEWRELMSRIMTECTDKIIAIDGEWSGQHPQNDNAQLRTIQISWKHKTAATIVLKSELGENFARMYPMPEEETIGGVAANSHFNKLAKSLEEKGEILYDYSKGFSDKDLAEVKSNFYWLWMNYIVCGHFLDSDIETLAYNGFIPNIWTLPPIPTTAEEYKATIAAGKPCLFDTAMAAHAYNETDDHSLTGQFMLRCPTVPRYDVPMDEWATAYCKKQGIKRKELPGYAQCPDHILIPYACYDADVTRRLALFYMENLSCDPYGLDCWIPFTNSMQQWPVFLEMNCTGLVVDRARMNDLASLYSDKCEKILAKIKRDTKWGTLNLNSAFQLRELLFGEKYNFAKQGGQLRPVGALALNLTPLYSTQKGMPWEKAVKEDGDLAVPACDSRSIAMLSHQYEVKFEASKKPSDKFISQLLANIRSYKLLRKVLSYVLKEADVDDEGNATEQGLAAYICDDGKLRTHLYQTLDTGRAASARPALQNISKRREADYKAIVGDAYIAPLRTILRASPGHMLVWSDIKGAELAACAILADDNQMLAHVQRNLLPEDDPDFYDIHSALCCAAFHLDCDPTKAGLEAVGMKHLRIVAKSIIFGLMYGRGAAAIAEAVKEEKCFVTVDEVKQVMNTVKKTYPKAMEFLQDAANAVLNTGYIVGVAGRYRRIPKHEYLPADKMADLERVFKNFPMQNFVAEYVRQCLTNLYYYRGANKIWYNINLQVHDEILLEVPYQHVEEVIDNVIPKCMVEDIPVWPRSLTGELDLSRGPYFLGTDSGCGFRYGESVKDWRELVQKEIANVDNKA